MVGTARSLYERFKQLIHEAAKFGIIGVVGVFVNNAIYDAMHFGGGIGSVTSAVVGAVVTTIMSYIGNRYWSFRHRERSGVGRETLLFFLLNGVGILIQVGTVGLVDHGFGLTGKLANAIALNLGIAAGTVFRFWSYRKWIWIEPQDAPEHHEELEPVLMASASAAPTRDQAERRH